MQGAVTLSIAQFSLIYLLLLVVLFIMKRSKIDRTKLLIIASVRMTVQLVLIGFILQYIFSSPNPILTILFLTVMIAFSIHRVLSTRKELNKKFKVIVSVSLAVSGLTVLMYFVGVVVGQNVFNPQYTIPLAGMIIGNAMTGLTLGLKTFSENINMQRRKIDTLTNLGV